MMCNRCQLCQTLLLLDSDAIASHLNMHSKSGMTHAKYNSLYMNITSRPASLERQASVERPVSIERPTKRPASAGQHLVGERPGNGLQMKSNQRPLSASSQKPAYPGQQGHTRVTKSSGQPLKKGQGLWAASERQVQDDEIEVVKEVEAGELKQQQLKNLESKEKKRAESWNEPLEEEEILDLEDKEEEEVLDFESEEDQLEREIKELEAELEGRKTPPINSLEQTGIQTTTLPKTLTTSIKQTNSQAAHSIDNKPKSASPPSPKGCKDCSAGRVHQCLEDEDEDMEDMEEKVEGQQGDELVLQEDDESEEEDMDLGDEEYNSDPEDENKTLHISSNIEKGKVMMRGLTISSKPVEKEQKPESKPNQLPLGLSIKGKSVLPENNQIKQIAGITSKATNRVKANAVEKDETMAIAMAIAAVPQSPKSKRPRDSIQNASKTLPSLTIKPKKAKTGYEAANAENMSLPKSPELTVNKLQNIFQDLQDKNKPKEDGFKSKLNNKKSEESESESSSRPASPAEKGLTVQSVQDILQNVQIDVKIEKVQKNAASNKAGNRSPSSKNLTKKNIAKQDQKLTGLADSNLEEEEASKRASLDTKSTLSPFTESTLEAAFIKDEYPMLTERKVLAASLNLTEKVVRAWFVSRRTAKFEGRQSPCSSDQLPSPATSPSSLTAPSNPSPSMTSHPPSPSVNNSISSPLSKGAVTNPQMAQPHSPEILPRIPSPELPQAPSLEQRQPQNPPPSTNPSPPHCSSCGISQASRAELLRHLQADHYDLYITELLDIFYSSGSTLCRQCGSKSLEEVEKVNHLAENHLGFGRLVRHGPKWLEERGYPAGPDLHLYQNLVV